MCFDLPSFVDELWRGSKYQSIDNITISANCKIRRIFTMKVMPNDTTDNAGKIKFDTFFFRYIIKHNQTQIMLKN